jgi:quinoprotein glucose dehydrogenase
LYFIAPISNIISFMQKFIRLFLNLYLFIALFPACQNKKDHLTDYEWKVAGGNQQNTKYVPLDQVDTSNVQNLQVAWIYHTGDADTIHHSQIQCNPLIVDGVLYGISPQLKLFALDAATGTQKWVFNPFDSVAIEKRMFFALNNSRGLSYWSDGANDKRVFYTAGSYLHCLNAITGKLVAAFGDSGKVDLHEGLGRDVKDLFITSTSPGMIYKDLLIVGTRVDEGPAAAPGHVRAYQVRTGKLEWIFHTIPQPGEQGYETWDDTTAYKKIGGANSWSGMSLDDKRGIVFVPTGSASFDFYGGKRTGNNLYADCLLALDAATGKRIWHFQQIHHDIWDRDLPTPPSLVTVTHNGQQVDAVAQVTKTGFVFLFERETGRALFPIEEKPVPTDTELKGEKLSSSQPIPTRPAPFVRQNFTEDQINDLLHDTSYNDVKKRWASYRKDHMYAPLTLRGTIVFPGLDGGGEWGGAAFDPESGLLYVNANEMAWIITMKEKPVVPKKETYAEAGVRLYRQHCMACHGEDRKGTGNFPSVVNMKSRYNRDQLLELINSGRRMMPGFKQLTEDEKEAISSFLLEQKKDLKRAFQAQPVDSFLNLPYGITGYNKFLSKEGYPAIKPPWGTLNAINLNTGELSWKIPLGEYPEFKEKGIVTGTENYGGPVVTAGGILFIAATRDGKIRAINKLNGKILWEVQLPAPGFATPAVYMVNGKQYMVIACGGGKLETKSGDSYVAFALPD